MTTEKLKRDFVIVILLVVVLMVVAAWFRGATPRGGAEKETILVYFSNSRLKPTVACDESELVAVSRPRPVDSPLALAAIGLLLSGPTPTEAAVGFTTAIPRGSQLQVLEIRDGLATVDFNETINRGGGACHFSILEAQIRQTLSQVPGIRAIKISIDGQTEDVFQP